MYATLAGLIDQLASSALSGTEVIPWGSPVPAFGDPTAASVATLGLNPSNREFVDEAGRELVGPSRRFHTLISLGLRQWHEADARHLQLVLDACRNYFQYKPYDGWFRRLDRLLSRTGASYYQSASDASRRACHLDLIPYATRRKWMELNTHQRARLLACSADALGTLVRDSQICVLVLNGQTVVDHFETLSTSRLERTKQERWTLDRLGGRSVNGVGYRGVVHSVGGRDLGREVLVLGYNHNIQSSFGVTSTAILAIADWVAASTSEWLK